MRTATMTLESLAPYNQSRQHNEPKLDDETPQNYEDRTWREKAHLDGNGFAYIPPAALRSCIANAAKYLAIPIPGKGKNLYTKHFQSGILIADPLPLGIHRDDLQKQTLSMSGTGRKGQMGVPRHFPHFPKWSGQIEAYVLDPIIPEELFTDVVAKAGQFIGIGQYRPANGGYFGRFALKEITWA